MRGASSSFAFRILMESMGDLLFEKTAVTGVIIAPEKGDENRSFVAERYPAIIVGKRFYPGSLVNDQLRRLDDPPAK